MSTNVLAGAIEQLQKQQPALLAGKANPVAWLQAGVKVDSLSDVLLAVSMPGERRADQAPIIDAVVDSYLNAASDWESGRQRGRVELIQTTLKHYRDTLFALRRALRDTSPNAPERAAALRDEIGVLEEIVRRQGLALEEANQEAMTAPTIKRITKARP